MTMKILDLLKSKDVSIATLGRALGVSYQSAHRMAHRNKPPTWLMRYLSVIEALGITPEEFHEIARKWAKSSK